MAFANTSLRVLILIITLISTVVHQAKSQTLPANCLKEGPLLKNGSVTCETCNTGYHRPIAHDDTRCCPSLCDVCNETGQCLKCTYRAYLLNSRCEYCPSGCKECTSNTSCSTCEEAHFLDSNKICQRCMPGCVKCSSANACTECTNYRYYMVGDQCRPCMTDCETCSQGST